MTVRAAAGIRILLVRHGECEKNRADVQGGEGAPLTPLGRGQARAVGRYVEGWVDRRRTSHLISSPIEQVQATVEVGQLRRLVSRSRMDDGLASIDLGHLGGLSRAEAAVRYPDAARRLVEWEAGRLPTAELLLPGAEDLLTFRGRVGDALLGSGVLPGPADLIIVSTRSVLVMISNLLRLGSGFSVESYASYTFPTGGVSVWHGCSLDDMVPVAAGVPN